MTIVNRRRALPFHLRNRVDASTHDGHRALDALRSLDADERRAGAGRAGGFIPAEDTVKVRFVYPRFARHADAHPELREAVPANEYFGPPSLGIACLAAVTPPGVGAGFPR